MKIENLFAQTYFKPFRELKTAEKLLSKCTTDSGLLALAALLTQERVLDHCRPSMFERFGHGSKQADDYVFREYTIRHKISELALKMDKSITDEITGEEPYEKSVVAMYIKNRELYPKPVKKTKN